MSGATVASIADPFASASSYSMFSAPMLGATGDAIVFSGGGFSGRAASSSEQYDSRPLVSYNIAGKTIAWRSANAYLTHPAVANGVIYAARNAPPALDALSEADGHILWSWTPPAGNTSFHRNTVVTNNLVFVSMQQWCSHSGHITFPNVREFGGPWLSSFLTCLRCPSFGMFCLSGLEAPYPEHHQRRVPRLDFAQRPATPSSLSISAFCT
ncbi:MAG: hypothetical protein E6H61_10790 [Betaproteobacteria bacterium]|nr:MAG: hypothetical protein E6H61_10790 [Betaproteobacteria bacterium]